MIIKSKLWVIQKNIEEDAKEDLSIDEIRSVKKRSKS